MQVTIAEAARRLRLSEYTVRRRVRTGELPGVQVATPQGFVWMVEIEDESPDTSSSGELTAMRESLALLREQLVAKDKQIEQLHVLLQQAQAALPAPRNGRPWWRRWLSVNGA
jgi:hypothetical protein